MSRIHEPPMPDPLAYFITWVTYGTWLPGDECGWVEYRRGWQLPDPGTGSGGADDRRRVPVGPGATSRRPRAGGGNVPLPRLGAARRQLPIESPASGGHGTSGSEGRPQPSEGLV